MDGSYTVELFQTYGVLSIGTSMFYFDLDDLSVIQRRNHGYSFFLIFKGDHGNTREIAQINNQNDAGQVKTDSDIISEVEKIIRAFCAERNFKVYYIRVWNRDGITIFDVGSHSEFFHLKPEINIPKSE